MYPAFLFGASAMFVASMPASAPGREPALIPMQTCMDGNGTRARYVATNMHGQTCVYNSMQRVKFQMPLNFYCPQL